MFGFLVNHSSPYRNYHLVGFLVTGLFLFQLPRPKISIAQETISFAVVADIRYRNSQLMTVIDEINSAEPDFVVIVGDFLRVQQESREEDIESDIQEFKKNILSRFDMPVHLVPGNHDVIPSNHLSYEVWQRAFGPFYYFFDAGSSRFIILNSDDAANPQLIAGQQRAFLQQALSSASGIGQAFVFIHRPLWWTRSTSFFGRLLRKEQNEMYPNYFVKDTNWMTDVHPLLTPLVRYVFGGHVHGYLYEPIDGIRYIISGGGGDAIHLPPGRGDFHHFLLVTVHDGEIVVKIKRLNGPWITNLGINTWNTFLKVRMMKGSFLVLGGIFLWCSVTLALLFQNLTVGILSFFVGFTYPVVGPLPMVLSTTFLVAISVFWTGIFLVLDCLKNRTHPKRLANTIGTASFIGTYSVVFFMTFIGLIVGWALK